MTNEECAGDAPRQLAHAKNVRRLQEETGAKLHRRNAQRPTLNAETVAAVYDRRKFWFWRSENAAIEARPAHSWVV
jgi:hypothetical protein